jgi:hypothetical protein
MTESQKTAEAVKKATEFGKRVRVCEDANDYAGRYEARVEWTEFLETQRGGPDFMAVLTAYNDEYAKKE